MGIVYKARQKELQRVVALKMLLHGAVATPSDPARIRAASLLQHANIVPVHDVGEAGGRDYITMLFIEGRSLTQVLADGPLPPPDSSPPSPAPSSTPTGKASFTATRSLKAGGRGSRPYAAPQSLRPCYPGAP